MIAKKFKLVTRPGIPIGELPLRYLGIPLSHKKPSHNDCKILLDRFTTKLQQWTNKFLSYGGRLGLIQDVIEGMHSIWCQVFIVELPIV